MKKSLLMLSLFLLAVQLLEADDTVESLLRKAPYAEGEKRSIADVFGSAREQGVPESFLLPRLEEALAKKVPAGRLASVLRDEIGFLVRARGLLAAADPQFAAETPAAVWQRAALLLHNGVPEAVVGAVVRASAQRWHDFKAASELSIALTAWGLDAKESETLVVAVLASRLAASDFAGVAALFPRGRARDIPPRALARRLVKALPLVRTIAELEDRVLF